VSHALAAKAGRYYAAKLREHGPTPRGVDWNDERSQRIRFELLLELLAGSVEPFSLNDYGCGYGALLDSLAERQSRFAYAGYDVSPEMIAEAQQRYAGEDRARFTSDRAELGQADFTVASGLFNVKQDAPEETWLDYVLDTIDELVRLSSRGVAFNALTAHADPERRRTDLFYADPAAMLDHCLRRYSRDVALRHDYGLYEFTVIVHLDRRPPVAWSG
jgi:SAM-dependent methyltransferase